MNTIGCIPRVSVVVFGLLLLLPVVAVAQPVVLSGVINVSTPVASIDTSCNQQLEVMSSAGFFPGLKAVIMQMKGANISLIEGFSFGTIIDLNPAGQYEIVTIQGVVGNTIQLKYSLLNSYDPKQNVQLVSLPSYPSASISGLVSAKPWDGSSGGVIAMDVADTLFLSGTIDASGAGFRGGRTSVNKPTYTMHEYAFAWSTAKGGAKGEGIANVGTNYEAGRGPLANGGGGGNAVNTGGGGGANLARGGRGGKQYIGSGADEVMGIGGYSVPYSIALQRVFLGGGGGGPHQNDGTSTPGVNGGGIILIRAKSIVATPSGRIRSNGSDAATAGNDGAGGGGAGGTILLSAQDMTALSTEVKGGKGGDVTNTNTLNHCHGPGGGGGGGIVWVSASAVPPSLSVNASRGEAGLIVSMNTPCRNTTWGAEPGVAGGTLAGLAIKESAIGASAIRVTTSSAVMLCKDSCTTLSAHASGGTGPYTYQWSPPVGLSNPNDSVTRACPQGATTYLVSVTDAHGCSVSATVAVSILPGPLVTAGPPAIICKDSCVTLSAHAINSPGPFTYRWSPPTGLSNPTDSVTRACPQATTTYTVTVTDARGCQTAASVTITVLSAPGVSIMRSGDTLICSPAAQYQWYYEGVAIPGATLWRIKIGLPGRYSVRITDALGCVAVAEYIVTAPLKVLTNAPAAICLDSCATLVARTVGGTPPLRFSWIPNTDLSNPSDSVTRACPKVTTVYSVLVTDSLGTQMIGSVTVTVSQSVAPTITRSGDTLICSPSSTYQWYFAGAPIPGETRQTLVIGASGKYTVRVTDSLGCVAWKDLVVGVPIVVLINRPGVICLDSCVTLIAQTGGGIPPLRFHWMPATGLSSPDDSVTRACPKVTTVYSLLVTDSAGGQTSESVTVVVSQAAAPTITRSGDTLICSPASQYQWYLAGAPIPGETRQKLRIGASGTYSVRITDSLGCVAWRDYLIGAPITIRTNKPGSICRDSCVTLVAQTTGGLPPLRFRWIPATDLSNPNDSITRACPKTSTTYTILVTDSTGTQSAETIAVVVTQPALPVITRSRDTLYCSNALTYQWQYQGIPLPGETRQWLRIIWDGRYTVVTTDSNGCSASTDITAGNAPLTLRIAPPPPVCHDSCVTLVAVGNGGSPPYRFSWSPQTGLSHPDSAITGACPPSTTVYTLRIQDSAGTIKTEIVTVTVYPAPAAPVIRQYGDTLVSSPALTYQWYRDGVALPGETRQLLLIGRTGRYTVRTVDSSGCPASSDTLRILTPLYQAALGLSCIDSMEYEPGTVLTLPIFVREFSAASPVVLQRATVSLHFQKHVLQPILDSTMVMVDGERIRRVEITTRVPRALAQGMLFELPLIVMLGDTVCTEIVLDSLVLHTDKDVRVELRDTLCRICVRVCREGGVRLYRSDAGVLLLQNRPNPFNASTVIEYQLQREGHARLDVFDTKGRQIATPADGYHAAGAHRVFFDAQFLPSGVYAAVLRTASDVRVMLMTILK